MSTIMFRIILGGLMLAFPLHTFAQWSGNSPTPVSLSASQSGQWYPKGFTLADGSSVYFYRSIPIGKDGLFAQKLSSDGIRLLGDSGKKILERTDAQSFPFGAASDGNGNFWVAYSPVLQSGNQCDTLYLQKFDGQNLQPIWQQSKAICVKTGFENESKFRDIYLFPMADSLMVFFNGETQNNGLQIGWNRIGAGGEVRLGNGNVLAGYEEFFFPAIYPVESGFFIYSFIGFGANISPARLKGSLIDRNGSLKWSLKPVSDPAGSGILNQVVRSFVAALDDGKKGILCAFESYSSPPNGLFLCRLDSNGNRVWANNYKQVAATSGKLLSFPNLARTGDKVWISYAVRTSFLNTQLAASSYNLTTDVFDWGSGLGPSLTNLNTYSPFNRVQAITQNGFLALVSTGLANTSLVLQKMEADSIRPWGSVGVNLNPSADPLINPFDYLLDMDLFDDGSALVYWQANNLKAYARKISPAGQLVNETRPLSGQNEFEIFPNPSQKTFFMAGLDGAFVVQIVNLRGEVVFKRTLVGDKEVEFNASLPVGLYNAVIFRGGKLISKRFSIVP